MSALIHVMSCSTFLFSLVVDYGLPLCVICVHCIHDKDFDEMWYTNIFQTDLLFFPCYISLYMKFKFKL